jgi:Putative bacterial sensory transduction regulator
MLQTTFEIRNDQVTVDAPSADAELVAFAYCVAKTAAETDLHDERTVRVVVRFLNARRGPRVFLQVKPRGGRVPVETLAAELTRRREEDGVFAKRLDLADALLERLAAVGRVDERNELDVALACADVAWHTFPPETLGEAEEFCCSECGYTAPAYRFGRRLWPSEQAAIRRCPICGNGLWSRTRGRVRRIPHDVWLASESLREELLRVRNPVQEDVLEHDREAALLHELKLQFDENEWPYAEVLGLPVLVSDLAGPLGVWRFYAQVVDTQNVVLLFSVCPLHVPKERRSEASLFLTRANHGLVAGNFELDFEDGEIRYKTVLQIQENGIDRTTLKHAVRLNGLAMETYLPGIGAVITGASARSALARRTNDH